ncbi:hypothetical protein KKH36_02025 [Patescibacteria group bacterium]|nr:hypothetical protein [Patescibacteria group bacterium]
MAIGEGKLISFFNEIEKILLAFIISYIDEKEFRKESGFREEESKNIISVVISKLTNEDELSIFFTSKEIFSLFNFLNNHGYGNLFPLKGFKDFVFEKDNSLDQGSEIFFLK